jgi:hypothetical protein
MPRAINTSQLHNVESVPRLAITAEEAARSIGISEASFLDMIHAPGGPPYVLIHGRPIIVVELLRTWLLETRCVDKEGNSNEL